MVEINYDNRYFQLGAIYGPNPDTPSFMEDLFDRVTLNQIPECVLCGDWNVTQDHNKDNYNYVTTRNENARKKLKEIKTDWELIDPVDFFNIDRPHTTYEQASIDANRVVPLARLDYFWFHQS